jgi:hypothetical protein
MQKTIQPTQFFYDQNKNKVSEGKVVNKYLKDSGNTTTRLQKI